MPGKVLTQSFVVVDGARPTIFTPSGLTLASSVGAPQIVQSKFPLTVPANSRVPQFRDGTKFNVTGIAGWSYFANLSMADAEIFLADRAAKGINFLLASFIEHKFTDQSPAPRNKNGDLPFTGTVGGQEDFTTPNEPYWLDIDAKINLAKNYNMVICGLPCYLGNLHGDEGWAAEVSANGTSRMAAYGTFLGNRYKDFENLIWCVGGDYGPVSGSFNLTVHMQQMVNAIKAVDSNHLWTGHAQSGHGARADWGYVGLHFSTSYPNTESVWGETRDEYNLSPILPVLNIEATYGNEHGSTPLELRMQFFQAILGGAFGHVYGQMPEWPFAVDSSSPANSFATQQGLDWHNTLNSFGSPFITYMARLQAARDLTSLTPDYNASRITSSGATQPAAYSSQMLVVYTQGTNVSVNKAQFAAATFNTRWYNPRTGTSQNAGTGTASFGSGSQTFTVPDSNDWVLLCDDQALSLGVP